MDFTLTKLMNLRLRLTRVVAGAQNDQENEHDDESEMLLDGESETKTKKVKKYIPPIIYKAWAAHLRNDSFICRID